MSRFVSAIVDAIIESNVDPTACMKKVSRDYVALLMENGCYQYALKWITDNYFMTETQAKEAMAVIKKRVMIGAEV